MTLKTDEAIGEQPLGGARLPVLAVRHCLPPATGCSSSAAHSSLPAPEF